MVSILLGLKIIRSFYVFSPKYWIIAKHFSLHGLVKNTINFDNLISNVLVIFYETRIFSY